VQSFFRGTDRCAQAALQTHIVDAEENPPLLMKFNDVDAASFKASDYYQRWKTEFGPKAWDALEQYANRLA
jgi:hypothetical protein